MKIAFVWGTIFGVLQALITIIVSLSYTSPALATMACIGLLTSFALTFACSGITAFKTERFGMGFLAGMIATVYDLLAAVVGYLIEPATLQGGWPVVIGSWIFSIGVAVILAMAGAGMGVFVLRANDKV